VENSENQRKTGEKTKFMQKSMALHFPGFPQIDCADIHFLHLSKLSIKTISYKQISAYFQVKGILVGFLPAKNAKFTA